MLVVDYCNSGTLYKLVSQQPNNFLDANVALIFLGHIINGCKYLHDKKILHRDLSSKNILLHHDGTNLIAKICDFGFGKQVELFHQISLEYYDSSFPGTTYFQSPELISKLPYTYLTDIYSIGVIYYYMLFGCFPFGKSSNVSDIQHKQYVGDVSFEFKQCVSIHSVDLIMKCLKFEHDRIHIQGMIDSPVFKPFYMKLFYPPGTCISFNIKTYSEKDLINFQTAA